jgi:hypothetical protein
MSLPNQLNYSQTISELPECQNYEVCLTPATGATTYAPGGVIRFDFQNRGFIDPKSITLRYKYSATSLANAEMIATPAYTPFLRLETLIGSQVVESINQYNQVAGFLYMNTNFDVAMKLGQQSALGYLNNSTTPVTNEATDGRLLVNANESGTFSAPLVGLLFSSSKLVPAFAMPQISVQLTIDSIANMFTTTVVPTGFVLSNVELCYNMLDFGRSVESAILAMPKLFLKCNSYSNSSASVANATNGSISLVYNQKYASVKAAYVLPTGTAAGSLNKWADSFDMTQENGEYSIVIAGVSYPQRPLSTLNNKTYVLQELRRASGNLDDKNNNLAINSVEFYRTLATGTTYQIPAKFIIGIPLEKLHIDNEKAILSGVSTNNSNITVNISTATATAQAHTVNLILNYDAIIEVDTMSRDARVRQ